MLRAEQQKLAWLFDDFWGELTSSGVGRGELAFTVTTDDAAARLEAVLRDSISVPYSISSLGLLPVVIDPAIPFPLVLYDGASTLALQHGRLSIEGPCAYLDGALALLPARHTTWDLGLEQASISGTTVANGPVTGGWFPFTRDLDTITKPPDPSCRLDGGAVYITGLSPS